MSAKNQRTPFKPSSPSRSFQDSPNALHRQPQTHYDFFPHSVPSGPPPKGPFSLDLKALRNEYLQIQSSAHPDRHPENQKARAEATSAYINEAYRTLQDPLRRAQYILSLNGIDVAEDETAKVEDNELLMQVLETREVIEEAQDESELEPIRKKNGKNLERSLRLLTIAFEKGDWDAAKKEAVKLRYWVNIKDSVDNWERGKPVVLQH